MVPAFRRAVFSGKEVFLTLRTQAMRGEGRKNVFLLDPADWGGVSSDNEKTPDSRFGDGGRAGSSRIPARYATASVCLS